MSRKVKVYCKRISEVIKLITLFAVVSFIVMSSTYVGFLLYGYLASGVLLREAGFKISDLINVILVVISIGLAYWGFKIARDAAEIAKNANELSKSEATANREHNRLSVAPLLDVWCQIYPSDIGKLEITVANNGLGPALIEKLLMKKGDHIVFDSSIDTSNEWSRSLKVFFGVADVKFQNDTQNMFHTSLLEKGAVIRSNDSQHLIAMYVAVNNFNAEKATSDLEVKVEYKSVYGDSYLLEKIF